MGVDGSAKSDRSPQSLFHISVLNVAACFSVIMLHCNGVFWSFPEGKLWFTSNFIETFFYFAVPIFFMCSGITLLDYPKRYSTSEYFHKRISKTVIPFLFWSVMAFLYWACMDNAAGKAVDWNVAHIFVNILNTKYMGVYWFFIPLFGVYMSIPVLANLKNKREILRYIVILTLILGVALPLVCNVFSVQYNQGIVPGVLSGYLLFVAAGYLLNAHEFTRSQRYAIYAIALAGWLMHMGGTMILSEHGKGINQMFKGYLNLPAILQACGVFVFIKYEITVYSQVINQSDSVFNHSAILKSDSTNQPLL